MLLQDLPEPGEVEVLVVLEQDQTQVELGERELEIHHLPPLYLLVPLLGHVLVLGAVHLALERGELPGRLCQLLRVERVDLGQLLRAEREELLVEPEERKLLLYSTL